MPAGLGLATQKPPTRTKLPVDFSHLGLTVIFRVCSPGGRPLAKILLSAHIPPRTVPQLASINSVSLPPLIDQAMLPQSLAIKRYAPMVVLWAVKVSVAPTWSHSRISSQNRSPQGDGLTAFHSLP